MNKFLTMASVLLLGLSGYLGYRVFQLTQTKSILNKTCSSLAYDYSDAPFEGIINYETAQAMAENYRKDSAKFYITRNIKAGQLTPFVEREEDARSVWFSFDRLKNFIWHIEQQNCLNGCTSMLGLRIYFAKYPDLSGTSGLLEGLSTLPNTYSNHHTLFMVPTYQDKNGYNWDFYPPGKDCKTPLHLSPTHPGGIDPNETVHNPTPYIFLFDISQPAPGSQNHGGLIPPGPPTGTSF